MPFLGVQFSEFTFTSATELESNRLVDLTKSTGVVTYATYGSRPYGVISARSNYSSFLTAYRNSVWPISSQSRSAFVKLASSTARGALLFPVADGKVVASSYTAGTRTLAAQPTPGADAVYLLPGTVSGAQWSGHANAVAIYTHVGTSWSFVDVSSTANLGLTVYVTDEKRYYTWNGTAWVRAYGVITAMEAGVSGDEIAALAVEADTAVDLLSAASVNGIFILGQYSGNPGGTTVTIPDARIAAGDKVFCQFQGGTTAAYVVRAVTTAGTLTLTLSADSGANTLISYIVVRAI